jgi:hypothetical protein
LPSNNALSWKGQTLDLITIIAQAQGVNLVAVFGKLNRFTNLNTSGNYFETSILQEVSNFRLLIIYKAIEADLVRKLIL